MIKQLLHFFIHLRLHYNFFILSGPFFLGALFVDTINVHQFLFQYCIVYILLFGGANAYNSYFDKDEGPIGGLKHPPKMTGWMYYASWFLQILGLFLSMNVGLNYSIIYIISMGCFLAYSDPLIRLKGKPILSIIAMSLGAVFSSVLLGYFAAGGTLVTGQLLFGGFGASCLICSMYPFSQIYQIEEDTKRGDMTFTVKYGIQGAKKMFQTFFVLGIFILAIALAHIPYATISILIFGISIYFYLKKIILGIQGHKSEYALVMKTKYFGGMFFTIVMICGIIGRLLGFYS